jgi:hypothetical protein
VSPAYLQIILDRAGLAGFKTITTDLKAGAQAGLLPQFGCMGAKGTIRDVKSRVLKNKEDVDAGYEDAGAVAGIAAATAPAGAVAGIASATAPASS